MQIVLIASEQTAQAALLDVLRAAGMRALVASGIHTAGVEVCATQVFDSVDAAAPLFVLLEVSEGVDAAELHSAVTRAAAAWPEALLVACRRPAASHNAQGCRLDAAALQRLGFHAVADEPAQVPALLRELEDSGATMSDAPT